MEHCGDHHCYHGVESDALARHPPFLQVIVTVEEYARQKYLNLLGRKTANFWVLANQ